MAAPTDGDQLKAWLGSDSEDELVERLGALMEGLTESDASQQAFVAALSADHFAALRVLVGQFARRTEGQALLQLVQLLYMSAAVIPAAGRVLVDAAVLEHCRQLVSGSEDQQVVQFTFHLLNVCLTPKTTSVSTLGAQHAAVLGADFVGVLVDLAMAGDDDVAAASIRTLLHLHIDFSEEAGPVVVNTALGRDGAGQLGTALVTFLNRAEDNDESVRCLQLLADVFADARGLSLLFNSDLKVLLDVILREMDRELDDDTELYYLYILVLYGVVKSDVYAELKYRSDDIKSLLRAASTGKLADKRTGLFAGNVALECAKALA